MTPATVMSIVFALFLLTPPALGLFFGIRLVRASTARSRVPVTAVVVDRTYFRRPNHVTFDYPLPNGQWVRARRIVHLPMTASHGGGVEPGAHITVWVDPNSPHSVDLNPTGERAVFGTFLIVMSSVFLLFALAFIPTFFTM